MLPVHINVLHRLRQPGRHGVAVTTIGNQIEARLAHFKNAVDDRRSKGFDAAFDKNFNDESGASLDEMAGQHRNVFAAIA